MRDLPDRQLEPEDNSIEEMAAEQAEEDAWKDLLTEGDPSPILDDYVAEDQGEAFSMIRAYRADNQADMTSAAYKMAAKLEGIAGGYLK